MKQVKIVYAKLDNEQSIRKAEKDKTRYENQGYNLIGQDIGMFHAKFVYSK